MQLIQGHRSKGVCIGSLAKRERVCTVFRGGEVTSGKASRFLPAAMERDADGKRRKLV